MPKTTVSKPQCCRLGRRDHLVKANIDGLITVIFALQYLNEHKAALDLSREAFAAADARAKLFNLGQRFNAKSAES